MTPIERLQKLEQQALDDGNGGRIYPAADSETTQLLCQALARSIELNSRLLNGLQSMIRLNAEVMHFMEELNQEPPSQIIQA